ncbi:glycosyltransferase family 4 protein [bacterium]|nr:glycosyltransferase family 4 protein [bacterium]
MGIPKDKKIILYLHEIEEGRASLLPDIIRVLLSMRNDVVFIIAGDGRYRESLEKKLHQHISDKAVYFIGRVPNIATPRLYACADVYIMTSNFEAFSRVLLESMAMETPYVATDGGGNIRTYTPSDHQEYILSKSEWSLFPGKISELLDDRKRAEEFVRIGRDHVQQFSMEKTVDLFLRTVV